MQFTPFMKNVILFLMLVPCLDQGSEQAQMRAKIRAIARIDDPQQLEPFLTSGNFDLNTLIDLISSDNAPRCVQFLLDRSAPHMSILKDGIAEPLLFRALYNNNFEVAQVFLQNGSSPEYAISTKSQTRPLELFASNGDWKQTKWLLVHGASPHIDKPKAHDDPSKYCSLLRYICAGTTKHNDMPPEILHLFLLNNVNPNDSDTIIGDTCLHALIKRSGSSSKNKLTLIIYLIASGAQVNCVNNQLETPLHTAVFSNEKDIAAYLVLKGANKNAQNKNMSTPLTLVNTFSYSEKSRREYQELKNILESDKLPEMPAEAQRAEQERAKLKQKLL